MRSALTAAFITLCTSCLVSGQARADTVALISTSGTPLRIAIDETIPLTAIGQEVHGTLVEPL